MTRKIRVFGAGFLVAVWAVLACLAWVQPAKDNSEAERRPLAQFPQLSVDAVLNGKFMSGFEDYTLDQFPFRDAFRRLKSLTHYYGLNFKDNNGIYIVDGAAAKLDYPVNNDALSYAMKRLNYVYETYLAPQGSKVYAAVIPDKGYYLAEANGYPAMDYDALFETVRREMPWAEHIDLTQSLSAEDYYLTDTHWRQETLLPAAKTLCDAMGIAAFDAQEMEKVLVERPFYGVYYGQAALPMEPEDMYFLQNKLLQDCRVYHYDTNDYTGIYDMEKLDSKDLYDVFLSGAKSLLRIENSNAGTDRELIVFRDSFGSSMVPLLVKDYKSITMVDIRYLDSRMLDRFLEFTGQDVLFLYSTLVLNSGTSLK